MRYYIKSKLFKIKEDFWVKDVNGQECFFVDKEFFSFGLQFKVLQNNIIQYTVREKLLKFLPAYEVFEPNGNVVARVKKNFTFFRDSIEVESNYGDFRIEGDFFDYNYRIISNGRVIANIEKELLSFTDNYYVDIQYENEAFIIALVVIIDNIIDKQKND